MTTTTTTKTMWTNPPKRIEMVVRKYKVSNFKYATALIQKRFAVKRVFEIGDVALLRETFGANNACTGRASIFKATSVVNGVTTFSFVPAE